MKTRTNYKKWMVNNLCHKKVVSQLHEKYHCIFCQCTLSTDNIQRTLFTNIFWLNLKRILCFSCSIILYYAISNAFCKCSMELSIGRTDEDSNSFESNHSWTNNLQSNSQDRLICPTLVDVLHIHVLIHLIFIFCKTCDWKLLSMYFEHKKLQITHAYILLAYCSKHQRRVNMAE